MVACISSSGPDEQIFLIYLGMFGPDSPVTWAAVNFTCVLDVMSVGITSVKPQGESGLLMLSGHNKDEERIKTQKVDDGINVILFLLILLLLTF